MQLDELTTRWAALDQKLDKTLALGSELMQRVVVQPAVRRLHWSALWPSIDILFCAVLLYGEGNFLAAYWQDSRALLPAGILLAGTVALLVSSIWHLQRLSEIDWASPVAVIQQKLEQLRVLQIRQFKWIMLLSPLMGFCLLMTAFYWLVAWGSKGQANFFDKINHAWVVANYAVCGLFVPVGLMVCRWLSARFHLHPWWQSFLDGISGKTIQQARTEVNRWASLQAV
jgi:hypothetical protein